MGKEGMLKKQIEDMEQRYLNLYKKNKELLNYVKKQTLFRQNIIEIKTTDSYVINAIEFYQKYILFIEKIKQIKPRTIDTLEVGDYVEFEYPYYSDERLLRFDGRVKRIHEYGDIEMLDETFNNLNMKLTSTPIPHELIELMMKILGDLK